MIAIVNMGPFDDPDKGGLRTYEVRINSLVICTFKHYRADGLGRCLLEASKAVEKKKWEDSMLGAKSTSQRRRIKACAPMPDSPPPSSPPP